MSIWIFIAHEQSSLVTKPFRMEDAILSLDKIETGYNLLMEENAHTKCLIVHIHTGLLAVSFHLVIGATLS